MTSVVNFDKIVPLQLGALCAQSCEESAFSGKEMKNLVHTASGGNVSRCPVWLTIELGGFDHVQNLYEAYWKEDLIVGTGANFFFWNTPLSREPQRINLGCVTGTELGFTDRVTRSVVHKSILGRGGALCAPEDAIFLRRVYRDQPYNEEVNMVMELMERPGRMKAIYRLARFESWSGLYVEEIPATCEDTWLFPVSQAWVFRLP